MVFFPLPKDVLDIIARYEQNGYHAHIVGGPVRDFLLGIPPHDFDLTTDATPEETKAIFQGERIIETGIQHGTVTLLKSSVPYEITTYRIDGEYLDGRHPEDVTFTRSLAEDLARRDFTINAMAYAPSEGVIDLFDGRGDLAKNLLRAVGIPEKRFEEDALRILRALRFSSRLGFSIEEKTKTAIFSHAHLMRSLATERVMSELVGILCGRYAERVLSEYQAPLSTVLPELSVAFTSEKLPFDPKGVLPNPLANEESIEENSEQMDTNTLFFARFLILAHRAHLTEKEYTSLCERLHTSRALRDGGASILASLNQTVSTDYDILKLLSSLGEANARLTLELLVYLGNAQAMVREQFDRLLAEKRPYEISALAVKGSDLLALGYRGVALGETLNALLDATMRGDLSNTREALLAFVQKK